MKVSYTGLPGSGKSMKLGQKALECLLQNEKLSQKKRTKFGMGAFRPAVMRTLHSNMYFKKKVHDAFPQPWQIQYWTNRDQLIKLRDCDIIIDEEQIYFDAHEWEMMSAEEKRFFQQHRRFGVDIYGASQDFAQVDKSIRRITQELYYFQKLLGSRDISSTRPNPKYIWGVSLMYQMDPTIYDETISKITLQMPSDLLFITRAKTEVFDTREEIKASAYPPLKKIVRVCPEDGYTRVKYV